MKIMINRKIVIFEKDERHTEIGEPKIDFRLIRQALPSGACPLAIADHDGFTINCGQWFDEDQIIAFAEDQSGFTAVKI